METPTFKTIEQCRLELVAYSMPNTNAMFDMDRMPARAARVSFGGDDKIFEEDDEAEQKDRKLMKYLAEHQHMTPFEYQHATFMVECPLFIRSQIHRHRTFSFNEISRRYTSDELEFWMPTTWRKQSESNKQGSDGEITESEIFQLADLARGYEQDVYQAAQHYEWMLEAGVAREQARALLPQSLLTRFYMGGNLRNWVHFLKLRMDKHAQAEVQCIASRIYQQLYDMWPNSMRALMP